MERDSYDTGKRNHMQRHASALRQVDSAAVLMSKMPVTGVQWLPHASPLYAVVSHWMCISESAHFLFYAVYVAVLLVDRLASRVFYSWLAA